MIRTTALLWRRHRELGQLMKRIIAASLALSLLSAAPPAIAADMPVKAPVYKAPVFVADPWTGLYAGLNAGYSWGPWASSNPASVGNANFFNGTAFVNSASPRVDGAIGGVQIGYNWLVEKNFLLGAEADFQWSGATASQNGGVQLFDVVVLDNHFIGSAATTNDWKSRWFSTFRARAGFITADQWLIYATGGLALINAQYSTSATATLRRTTLGGALISTTATTVTNSETKTRVGFALGGGIEKKFSPNWNARLEYLYVDGGTHSFVENSGADTSIHVRDHIVRVGLNYMFGH
jgi:outer membrane immunogenic protein